MTSNRSITERAAILRRAYTGETWAQALTAVRESVQGDVLTALRATPELLDPELTRYMPRDGDGLLDELRYAVLPNANSWQQELLDIAVLTSLRESAGLPSYLRAEAEDQSEVVSSVSPHRNYLVVRCIPGMQAAFLASLIAMRNEDGTWRSGVPCTRFERKGCQVEVDLIGPRKHSKEGRLVVPGVHRNAWRALHSYIGKLHTENQLYRSPLSTEPPKNEEDAALDEVLYWHRHHVMTSKLARRIGLIRGSSILDAWTVAGGIFTVEYQSPWHLSIPDVAQALQQPLAGFAALYPQFASAWKIHDYGTIPIVEDGGDFPIRTSAGPDRGEAPVLQIRAIRTSGPLPTFEEELAAFEARGQR